MKHTHLLKPILKLKFTLLLLSGWLIFMSCQSETPVIMTVTGAIPTTEMGLTLAHEHLLVDFIGADSTGYHRWQRNEVVKKVLPYLNEIKALGVKTLVECTPAYLGRDPQLLQILSEQTGLHLLTNTGYYGARQNKFVPTHAFEETVEQLAARWINEWQNGIEATGIKPAFIKIAVDRDDTLSKMHQKIVRAAARTHLQTGLTIMSHTGPEKPALAQLAILAEEGVAPEAFIWTHAQRGTPAAHIECAQNGAWVSLDNMNADLVRVHQFVELLTNLKQHHLLDHVLISHDAGWYHVGEPEGGTFRSFTSIFTDLIPVLKKKGFSDEDINQLLVANPRAAFRIQVRPLK